MTLLCPQKNHHINKLITVWIMPMNYIPVRHWELTRDYFSWITRVLSFTNSFCSEHLYSPLGRPKFSAQLQKISVAQVFTVKYGSHQPRVTLNLRLNKIKNSVLQSHQLHFNCSIATCLHCLSYQKPQTWNISIRVQCSIGQHCPRLWIKV